MVCLLKPHTTSCTTKDCWVFSFWFQALDRLNCCRQSEVMSQISFTRRYVPLVVHGCVEETLFNSSLHIYPLKNIRQRYIVDWRTLIDRNESQMTTLKATFDPFVGTLTTTNLASYGSPQWLRIFSTILAQKYKIWRLKLPKWTK